MTSPFTLLRDAPLRMRNTFGIAARAPLLAEVADAAALPELLHRPEFAAQPPLLLGGGSNLLFVGDPTVPMVALTGHQLRYDDAGDGRVRVRAEAGANWHGFVMETLARGLGGLENLALIPGTVGAAPIQNIGAYGVEVREFVHAVEAYEPASGRIHRFDADACAFAYRDSLFKRERDRYIVTAVEFELPRADAGHAPKLDYAGIGDELAAMGTDVPTARDVAEAVIAIRRRKLPDPAVAGNAGSFFKNPIVAAGQAEALRREHPRLPVYPVAPFPADAAGHGDTPQGGFCKLSAAWLIDACGWKGHRDGDAGIAASHALVLVNHGNASGEQLLDLARRIAGSVSGRFGVALEPEPRIVGAQW
ncbi:UDP-N-acetylmuramate dehydrogenase [Marilutibacter chinensis]|uniref:UDP-N-acetylenolpyruvoylglucosamine reductase n=1 Tax=Marilutibacter chinensis TaxID=2912247 RepID=A0ABS9HQV8_9GAMM|nr:UDP-N-acetylmuramate dehydrogenase [Lysobacter chinensis]MCF7220886.1 UDP-N-acetylmuramate dehydrogenase [Lysobacter chinensis]